MSELLPSAIEPKPKAKPKAKPKPKATKTKPKATVKKVAKKPVAVKVEKEVKLTDRQERFCIEYLIDLNASQSAIRAGYSEKTAGSIGSENLKKPEIQKRIQELKAQRSESTGITAERVLIEAARLAFFDIRKLYNENGGLKSVTELDDDTAAAISSLEIVTTGDKDDVLYVNKYKLSDKNVALERLFKHLGLYERDNEQKTDPLSKLLETIASNSNSAFKPIQKEEG